MVVGRDSVLHPLDIAEAGVWAWSGRLRSVRIYDHGRCVDVSQRGQFSRLIPHVSNVEQEIRRQLALYAKVELLNVRTALVCILRTSVYGWGKSALIQQAL